MTGLVIRGLIRARYITFCAIALLAAYLVFFGERVGYEQSINSFFADDDPYMKVYQRAAATFGDDNFVFLVYDDPELLSPGGMDRQAELVHDIGPEQVQGVTRVEWLGAMPLAWAVDDALITLDRLPALARRLAFDAAKRAVRTVDVQASGMTASGAIRAAAGDPESLRRLKDRLTRHPLYQGTFIDREGGTGAIVARLKKTSQHDVIQTVAGLRKGADAFAARHGLGRPAVVGPPVLLADGFRAIEVDGRRLAVVGMLLIAIVTFTAVRSPWWAIVPVLSGWTVWLATEALLARFHIKLALSGGPVAAQIIVLTMPAASHLAIHFRDHRGRSKTDPEAARSTLAAVVAPIAWTAVTGAIGYGALATSQVMPVRQFGVILGVATLAAAVLVVLLAPFAMLPPISLEARGAAPTRSRSGRLMNWLILAVYRHPAAAIAALALLSPAALGVVHLRYETNYINLFKPTARVVRDYYTAESRLGGIGLVELVAPLEKGITPEALDQLRQVDDELHALDLGDPGAISQVVSLATVLDPDRRLAALDPVARKRLLADKLALVELSPERELLSSFWNPTSGETRLLVRLKEQQSAQAKTRIFETALASGRRAFGAEAYLTGLSYLMTRTTQAVVATQWTAFFWSATGILIMLVLAFRRVPLAILALAPTLLAVGLVLGLMGWLGIKLDMATALVASVALGLSVDDTFHCLLQYLKGGDRRGFRRRLFESYRVSGPGVLLSSLAVAVGFLSLLAGEFEPFVNFGAMVAVATAGSTIGNVILIPACLTLAERRRGTRNRELAGAK